jgi:plastocyanin
MLHAACNFGRMGSYRRWVIALVAGVLVVAACASGDKSGKPEAVKASGPPIVDLARYPGETTVHLKYGPITVKPGQNNIVLPTSAAPVPTEKGYITSLQSNIVREDGSVPPVDVLHLHHGVWLTNHLDGAGQGGGGPFYATGEEKTTLRLPEGYGYPFDPATDKWGVNYMLHNLFPTEEQIWITYDLGWIPATAPQAKNIRKAHMIWMDVEKGRIYPVFDVIKGSGEDGVYTYPDDAPDAYQGRRGPKNEFVADRDVVILSTGGHLHPGGLHSDLYVSRAGAGKTASADAKPAIKGDEAHLFESKFFYYEPAGAVSWDVSATVTPKDYRVAIKKGDVLSLSASYDSKTASWYESMGIMNVWVADGTDGVDPFQERVDQVEDVVTHGHLPENNNHGGKDFGLPDPNDLPGQAVATPISIVDFIYGAGDISEGAKSIPTVKPGESITFDNVDAPKENGIWHTITSCKAPCTQSTGIAFPRADADIQFDSGQLGVAGPPTAGRTTWQTPTDLPAGTYTYFCRVHPFMRGAFRVTQ